MLIKVRLTVARDMSPLIIAMAMVMILLLVPLGNLGLLRQHPALRDELQNVMHPVVFAALAVVGRQTLHRSIGSLHTWHFLLLAGALAIFGFLTELLQEATGRERSLTDFIGDLLGICSGLLWSSQDRAAAFFARLAALLACVPLICTSAAYLYRQAHLPQIWHTDSLLLNRFSRWQTGRFPGIVLEEVPPDWRPYRLLVLTVRNPGTMAATFTVRVHDAHHDQRHDDRFNRSFRIEAGTVGVFEIPLREIVAGPAHRPLDLAAVAGIVLFQDSPEPGRLVAPIQIHLAR
jgi:hypothetical protein